jgi:hypothetical protein
MRTKFYFIKELHTSVIIKSLMCSRASSFSDKYTCIGNEKISNLSFTHRTPTIFSWSREGSKKLIKIYTLLDRLVFSAFKRSHQRTVRYLTTTERKNKHKITAKSRKKKKRTKWKKWEATNDDYKFYKLTKRKKKNLFVYCDLLITTSY